MDSINTVLILDSTHLKCASTHTCIGRGFIWGLHRFVACCFPPLACISFAALSLKASLFLRVSGRLVLREQALSCTVSALDSAWRCSQMEKPCLEDVLWDIKALLFHCCSCIPKCHFPLLSLPFTTMLWDMPQRDDSSSHWGSIWKKKQNAISVLWPLLLSVVYFQCNILAKEEQGKSDDIRFV